MKVNAPAAVSNRVLEDAVVENIGLVEYIIAHQTARFARAGEHSDPFELVILRAVVAAVLDVIPNTVKRRNKLVADVFIIGDDVVLVAHQLDPEIAVINSARRNAAALLVLFGVLAARVVDLVVSAMHTEAQIVLGVLLGKRGGSELDGVTHISCAEEDGVAHSLVVSRLGSVDLAGFSLRFASLTVFGARIVSERAVSGAVCEERSGQAVAHLGRLLNAERGGDAVALGLAVVKNGIIVNGKIFGIFCRLKEDHIPDRVGKMLVARLVFEHQLVKQTAFGEIGLFHTVIGTRNMHSDLARCIAAKDGTSVNKRSLRARARSFDSCTNARHSAADNDEIV